MNINSEIISLQQLVTNIKEIIAVKFTDSIWIHAEVSDFSINKSGHAYFELVEKDAYTQFITAKIKAMAWSNTFRIMQPYFQSVTGKVLQAGLKILIKVSVEFHEVYGISLIIRDIEPSYTVGEMEIARQKTLEQLTNEGIINMNAELPFPLVPQRIAIISSKTAAGYQDFCNELVLNKYGFKYHLKAFDAVMQGDEAEKSIIAALNQINNQLNNFDIVVLIRGGGSKVDLSCFDNYWLNCNLAQFPLPVLTGIGHERDNSIADRVAHKAFKTPTAVAQHIIHHTLNFTSFLDNTLQTCVKQFENLIYTRKTSLQKTSYIFSELVTKNFSRARQKLTDPISALNYHSIRKINTAHTQLQTIKSGLMHFSEKKTSGHISNIQFTVLQLNNSVNQLFASKLPQLKIIENQIILNNPENILKKGYTLTIQNGKIVKRLKNINLANEIETKFTDGTLISNPTKSKTK